jgi:hypothetical protein
MRYDRHHLSYGSGISAKRLLGRLLAGDALLFSAAVAWSWVACRCWQFYVGSSVLAGCPNKSLISFCIIDGPTAALSIALAAINIRACLLLMRIEQIRYFVVAIIFGIFCWYAGFFVIVALSYTPFP